MRYVQAFSQLTKECTRQRLLYNISKIDIKLKDPKFLKAEEDILEEYEQLMNMENFLIEKNKDKPAANIPDLYRIPSYAVLAELVYKGWQRSLER